MVDVLGGAGEVLTEDEVIGFVGDSLAGAGLEGRSVCVIVPDATRSCPLPLLLKAVHKALDGRVSQLTILVALGTHAEMTADQLRQHLGGDYPNVINHAWWKPDTFVDLGTISADRVGEISDEMLRDEVPVRLNRAVVEHDVALVVGPVFPHEVVGFSGGNKYFFPGVAGQEVIDLSHWLGALITSA
ncbi:MAG TPA: lactate racemase domain-containing protein, partial [Kribbella sp.]|nr:lactate racemase domain-containing protein [Kribbella sp.]